MTTTEGTVLVLRTCNADMTSRGGFVWPASGPVEAPDWSPEPVCGKGLHGFLWGEGRGGLASWEADARWLVVEVDAAGIIDLDGKVKFPRGVVVHCGDRLSATTFIIENGARGRAVIGCTLTGGDCAVLTGGYCAVLTGRYGATLTGGDGATLTGGNRAVLTGGHGATLTGGHDAVLTGGHGATLTGGDGAVLAGGHDAVLTGGDGATLTGGSGATLTGGSGSTLIFSRFDRAASRRRVVIAYPGEDGIEPGKPYHLNSAGVVVPAEGGAA